MSWALSLSSSSYNATVTPLIPCFPALSPSVYSQHRNQAESTVRVRSCLLCAQNSPVNSHNTDEKSIFQ